MKKVLISILIVLLVVLAYFTIVKGLTVGEFKVLSAKEIVDANDQLDSEIQKAQSLLKIDYPSKKEELSSSVTDLLNKKEEYFKAAKLSSDKEITKANTEETYYIEYLWTRIGNHATSKGVNLTIDVKTGDAGEANVKNLTITAKGYYVGIMDFVSSLENDDKLNFKIENFNLVQEGELLTATFNVRGIRIKTENTTASSSTTTTTQETDTANKASNNTTTEDTSKLNQLTGAVDNALTPAENTQQ